MRTYKYRCIYIKKGKRRQITFRASSRAMAIIGLVSIKNIFCNEIVSLNLLKIKKDDKRSRK